MLIAVSPSDAETLALIADAEEKRIMTELMTSVKKEANSRRVPVACDQNAAPGDVQDTARDAQDTPRDVQDTARDAHATSDDEHVASQNFMLFTDMFPFSEQVRLLSFIPSNEGSKDFIEDIAFSKCID